MSSALSQAWDVIVIEQLIIKMSEEEFNEYDSFDDFAEFDDYNPDEERSQAKEGWMSRLGNATTGVREGAGRLYANAKEGASNFGENVGDVTNAFTTSANNYTANVKDRLNNKFTSPPPPSAPRNKTHAEIGNEQAGDAVEEMARRTREEAASQEEAYNEENDEPGWGRDVGSQTGFGHAFMNPGGDNPFLSEHASLRPSAQFNTIQ